RLFVVIDSAAVQGYHVLDILQLDQVSRPDPLTVGALRVYRRRAVAPSATRNQNVGGVRAVACAPGLRAVDCSIQREGPFEWEILQEGKDYYVDPTGTWFALANRLDQSDYLAASYISASRADSVGTFPVDARSDSLYRTPRAYLATQGPPSVFALRLHADATASPDRSLLSLNSFQIREGSERLYLGTRLLTREADYTIDYTTGQVQFKNPDAL